MLWNIKNGSVNLDGSKMDYVSFGKGKEVLVLIPGLSDGLTTVKGKALLLSYQYRIFIKDFKVYIFSRKENLPNNYTISCMADDQAASIKSLGIKKAAVLGVSEGGMIAQYLSINYPDLVDKLVISVSAPKINEVTRNALNLWISDAKKGDHKKLMIDTTELSYSDLYLKKYRKLYPIIGYIGKPKSYDRFLTNANAILNFDALEKLEKISSKTLIIGGKLDKIVGPDASYEMHEKIKGSELFMYEEYGHAAYEEAKDFNKRVYDFLIKD